MMASDFKVLTPQFKHLTDDGHTGLHKSHDNQQRREHPEKVWHSLLLSCMQRSCPWKGWNQWSPTQTENIGTALVLVRCSAHSNPTTHLEAFSNYTKGRVGCMCKQPMTPLASLQEYELYKWSAPPSPWSHHITEEGTSPWCIRGLQHLIYLLHLATAKFLNYLGDLCHRWTSLLSSPKALPPQQQACWLGSGVRSAVLLCCD